MRLLLAGVAVLAAALLATGAEAAYTGNKRGAHEATGAEAARTASTRGAQAAAGAETTRTGGKRGAQAAVLVAPPGDPNQRLEAQIAAIKAAPDPAARGEEAGKLVDALLGVNPASVTPQTISDLSLLLAHADNEVRYWTALALGQLGARAASVIPALEKALKDAEKLAPADPQTPAHGICIAFARIGAAPSDGRCVKGQYLTAEEKRAYDAAQAKRAPPPAAPTAAPAPTP